MIKKTQINESNSRSQINDSVQASNYRNIEKDSNK